MKKILTVLAAVLSLTALTSCESEIVISADNAQGYSVKAAVDLGTALYNTIQNLTEYSGTDLNDSFFSEKEIQRICSDKTLSANFITCTSSSLKINISPECFQNTYNALSKEDQAYLDLLMAPSITNEELSKEEYKDLVASIYGDELADEMWNAKLKVTLECPSGKKIKKALSSGRAVSHSEKKASFEIPVVYLLTLRNSATWSIEW